MTVMLQILLQRLKTLSNLFSDMKREYKPVYHGESTFRVHKRISPISYRIIIDGAVSDPFSGRISRTYTIAAAANHLLLNCKFSLT